MIPHAEDDSHPDVEIDECLMWHYGDGDKYEKQVCIIL